MNERMKDVIIVVVSNCNVSPNYFIYINYFIYTYSSVVLLFTVDLITSSFEVNHFSTKMKIDNKRACR